MDDAGRRSPKREDARPRTLRAHFARAFLDAHRRRPVSFYLMFAILAVVLLGGQVVYVREDPRRFALFLILNFVAFFVIMMRALVDFMEIVRDHFKASGDLYRETLGDPGFAQELGRRVAERQKDSGEKKDAPHRAKSSPSGQRK